MPNHDAAVARSDAAERSAYASLTGDPDTLAAARAALLRADEAERRPDGPDARVRQAVIESDPVTAAGLGWLTMSSLVERIHASPRAFLSDAEARVIDERGLTALRLIVRARVMGQRIDVVVAEGADFSATHDLAARGNFDDADRVRRLLARNGLLDDDGRSS